MVGDDEFGRKSIESMGGVDTENIKITHSAPTAIAAVIVDANGENQICVGSCANNLVSAQAWIEVAQKEKPDALLLQMEIPSKEVFRAIKYCSENNIRSILNAAPADEDIPTETLEMLDILIVNEHEVLQVRDSVFREGFALAIPEVYTEEGGEKIEKNDPRSVAHQLARSFELIVIVTLGEEGCAVFLPNRPNGVENQRIDTIQASALELKKTEQIKSAVGAGDAFVGAFCAYAIEGRDLHTCLQAASACGTLACLTAGAREGVPTRAILESRRKEVSVEGNFGEKGISILELESPSLKWCRSYKK